MRALAAVGMPPTSPPAHPSPACASGSVPQVARAFRTWDAKADGWRRLQTLGKVMIGRWRAGVLGRVFGFWARYVASSKRRRADSALSALSLLSGRHEMLLKLRFVAWRDLTSATVARRRELAGKALGRYLNQVPPPPLLPGVPGPRFARP